MFQQLVRWSFFKSISVMIIGSLLAMIPAQSGFAQVVAPMPAPGEMAPMTAAFAPARMVGMRMDFKNPFNFYFIMNKGEQSLDTDIKKNEYDKLIRYFLASLTTPNNDMWVNLSPYESNRIIPDNFSGTQMGRDLLAQDYLLKQFTSSLMYPEDQAGKTFWAQVYARAAKEFGTTDIPVDTFNKVWIMAERADIYQKDDTVFLVDSHLKVMLEQDFMAVEQNKDQFASSGDEQSGESNEARRIAADVVREVIIPIIEKEVNEGANFAQVRQIYNSMILAAWFKKTLKESLLGQVYADKSKVAGVQVDDPQAREKIYQQYLEAYKVGVFNYIKEEADPLTQELLPRKYFAGGAKAIEDSAMRAVTPEQAAGVLSFQVQNDQLDAAQTSLRSAKGKEFRPAAAAVSEKPAARPRDMEWWKEVSRRLEGMTADYQSKHLSEVRAMVDLLGNIETRLPAFEKGKALLERVWMFMANNISHVSAPLGNVFSNPFLLQDDGSINERVLAEKFDAQEQKKVSGRIVSRLEALRDGWEEVKVAVSYFQKEAEESMADFDLEALEADRLAAEALRLYHDARSTFDSDKKQQLTLDSEDAILRYLEHPATIKPWWGRFVSPLDLERAAFSYRRYLKVRSMLMQINKLGSSARDSYSESLSRLPHPGFKAWLLSRFSIWPVIIKNGRKYKKNLDQWDSLKGIVQRIPAIEELADQQVLRIEKELRAFGEKEEVSSVSETKAPAVEEKPVVAEAPVVAQSPVEVGIPQEKRVQVSEEELMTPADLQELAKRILESQTQAAVVEQMPVEVETPQEKRVQIPEEELMTPEDLQALLAGRGKSVAVKAVVERPEFRLPSVGQPAAVEPLRIDLVVSRIADQSKRVREVVSEAVVAANELKTRIGLVKSRLADIDEMRNSLTVLTSVNPKVSLAALEQAVREESAAWEAREQALRAQNRDLEQRQRMVQRNISTALAADPDAEVGSLENQSVGLKQQIAENLDRIRSLSAERVKAQDVSLRQLEQFRTAVAWGQEQFGQVFNAEELMDALDAQRLYLQGIAAAAAAMQEKLKKTRQVENRKSAIDGLTARFVQMNASGIGQMEALVENRKVVEQALGVLQSKYDTERAGANRGKSLARIRKEMNRLERTLAGMNITIGTIPVEPNIVNNYMDNERLLQEAENVLLAAKLTARAVSEQLDFKVRTDNAQDNVGGITMSDKHLTINIKVDGAGMPLPASMQDPAMVNIEGLLPVIHQIVPVTPQNVPVLADLMRSGL